MIVLKDVTVVYDKEIALNKVNLQIKKGTALAIIGHSGSGKTTLLNVLAGLIQPSNGQIHLQHSDGSGPPPSLSLVMQSAALYPWLTLAENVDLGLRAEITPASQREHLVHDVLSDVDLLIHKNKYPSQISGGQAQRTSIARSWVSKPDILLLDEPTSSLDAITKEDIQMLLKTHQKSNNNTSILVTHSIEEAVYLGQTILILHKGSVVAQFDNECYSLKDARNQKNFYDKVLEIRNAFKEVHTLGQTQE